MVSTLSTVARTCSVGLPAVDDTGNDRAQSKIDRLTVTRRREIILTVLFALGFFINSPLKIDSLRQTNLGERALSAPPGAFIKTGQRLAHIHKRKTLLLSFGELSRTIPGLPSNIEHVPKKIWHKPRFDCR